MHDSRSLSGRRSGLAVAMKWLATHLGLFVACYACLLGAEPLVRLGPSRVSLGRFPANCPPSAELFLVNGGESPLEGIRVRTSCGCLTATLEDNVVPAGGRLRICLSFAPEKADGPFSHSVFVEAEDHLLRGVVTGDAVPLFIIRPSKSVNLGDIPCGSPYQVEFLWEATEEASLGKVTVGASTTEIEQLGSTTFRVTVRGVAPGSPGRFRISVSVPIEKPAGWFPVELVVFGNAVDDSGPEASPLSF